MEDGCVQYINMVSYFESLFTTKDIVRKKYPGGWIGWINDGMSDDDDGQLTRFTTMCGYHMHDTIEKLIKYGFKEPEISNDNINFNDFYLDVYEYNDYSKLDYSKYKYKLPNWLKITIPKFKSIKEIDEQGLDLYEHTCPDFSIRNYN